ncbi:tripartite tricarboxylate transporter substrate binding protein [Verticiella sediminum]
MVGALLLAAGTVPASAAGYPDRPITLFVGFSPGGGVDVVGRLLAQHLGEALKTPVVVENKAGFSGNLAAQQASRAPADGHTLLMTPATTYVLSQKLMGADAVGYDLLRDFDAVSSVGEIPLVLLAKAPLDAHSLQDLAARDKANDGTPMTYGSSGVGSIEHVAMELLREKTGQKLTHVPYKGSSPTMTDLLGGQIDLAFATAPTALANLPSGRVSALGITSAERSAFLQEVPTFSEQGVDDFTVASLFALLAPKGVDAARLQTLNEAVTAVLRKPEVVKRLADLGVTATPSSLPESAERMRREADAWNQAIDRTGISAE